MTKDFIVDSSILNQRHLALLMASVVSNCESLPWLFLNIG